jgi:hypothetical protein
MPGPQNQALATMIDGKKTRVADPHSFDTDPDPAF